MHKTMDIVKVFEKTRIGDISSGEKVVKIIVIHGQEKSQDFIDDFYFLFRKLELGSSDNLHFYFSFFKFAKGEFPQTTFHY